jgi:hypothetical protein
MSQRRWFETAVLSPVRTSVRRALDSASNAAGALVRCRPQRSPPDHALDPTASMSITVVEGCAIATVDDERREIPDGHLVLDGAPIAEAAR